MIVNSGNEGIRTPGPVLAAANFQDLCIKPTLPRFQILYYNV